MFKEDSYGDYHIVSSLLSKIMLLFREMFTKLEPLIKGLQS